MKSFATLCLLAIATAVQLQRGGQDGGEERDGGCKRPRPCSDDIDEQGLQELKEGIVEGVKELSRQGGEDEAEQERRGQDAGDEVEKAVREGKSCDAIGEKIREKAKEAGVDSDDVDEAMDRLGSAAEDQKEKTKERREKREKKAALAQKKGGKRPGPKGEESAEGSDTERELGDAKAELEEALDVEIDLDDVVEACKKLLSEDDDEEGDEPRPLEAAQLDADVVEEVVEKVREELGDEGAKKLKAKAKAACKKGKRAIEKKEAEGDDDGEGPSEKREKPQGEADEDGEGPAEGEKRGPKPQE